MKRSTLAAIAFAFAMLFALDVYAQEADPDAPPAEKKEEEPSTLKTLGSIGLAVIGLVMVGIPAAKTFSSSLSYAQAKLNLVNFLRTNPYQAEQMAKRMEGTFAEPLAMALKAGGMSGSTDPKVVVATTGPTYDANATGMVAKLGGVMSKAKLGLMAAVGGAGIGLAGGSLIFIPIILAVLTGAAFLRIMWYKSELDSSIIRARAEILPEVNDAICSRRYVAQKLPGQ